MSWWNPCFFQKVMTGFRFLWWGRLWIAVLMALLCKKCLFVFSPKQTLNISFCFFLFFLRFSSVHIATTAVEMPTVCSSMWCPSIPCSQWSAAHYARMSWATRFTCSCISPTFTVWLLTVWKSWLWLYVKVLIMNMVCVCVCVCVCVRACVCVSKSF